MSGLRVNQAFAGKLVYASELADLLRLGQNSIRSAEKQQG